MNSLIKSANIAAIVVVFTATGVAIANTQCGATSPVPPGTTVQGNLEVPPGQICVLSGVTVTGNVFVDEAATLDGTPGGNNFMKNVGRKNRIKDLILMKPIEY